VDIGILYKWDLEALITMQNLIINSNFKLTMNKKTERNLGFFIINLWLVFNLFFQPKTVHYYQNHENRQV